MEAGLRFVYQLLTDFGFSDSWAVFGAQVIALLLLLLVLLSIEFIIKRLGVHFSSKFRAKLTKKAFLYDALSPKMVRSAAQLFTPFILLSAIPLMFSVETGLIEFTLRLCNVYIIAVILRFITFIMSAIFDFYSRKEEFRDRPLRGLLQTGQAIVLIIGAVLIISIFIGQKPIHIFTGLGASAAVLMLVFQDSILGVVSGIQLSANDMLRVGDWITVPSYGADGTVLEVSLNTVKVQNFDKTITTLPPYALIKDSFHNWRGMFESGGRRVKRSINIDMTSVKFCTPEMLERFSKIELLKDYISDKNQDINKYNTEHNIDNSMPINGRQQTNLGVFRHYLTNYLHSIPGVKTDFLCMVRQLQPTEDGIPLELYFFSADTNWLVYEALQADVFDHLLAAISIFELRVFQTPSGTDLMKLGDQLNVRVKS